MAESLSQIYLHIIFSTKRRERLISPKIQKELYNYMAQLIRNKKCICYEVGGIEDHVHIACSLSRSISTAELVRDVKNNSSRWMSSKIGYFRWQDGYAAFSISPNHLDALRHYIKNQETHHNGQNHENELRELCAKYNVEYSPIPVGEALN